MKILEVYKVTLKGLAKKQKLWRILKSDYFEKSGRGLTLDFIRFRPKNIVVKVHQDRLFRKEPKEKFKLYRNLRT